MILLRHYIRRHQRPRLVNHRRKQPVREEVRQIDTARSEIESWFDDIPKGTGLLIKHLYIIGNSSSCKKLSMLHFAMFFISLRLVFVGFVLCSLIVNCVSKLLKLQNLVVVKWLKIQILYCKVCEFCICLYYVRKLGLFSAQKRLQFPHVFIYTFFQTNFAILLL